MLGVVESNEDRSLQLLEKLFQEYNNGPSFEMKTLLVHEIVSTFSEVQYLCDNLSFFPYEAAKDYSWYPIEGSLHCSCEKFAPGGACMEKSRNLWAKSKENPRKYLLILCDLLRKVTPIMEYILEVSRKLVPINELTLELINKVSFHFIYFMSLPIYEVAEIAISYLMNVIPQLKIVLEDLSDMLLVPDYLFIFFNNNMMTNRLSVYESLHFIKEDVFDIRIPLVEIDDLENRADCTHYALFDMKLGTEFPNVALFYTFWHKIVNICEGDEKERRNLFYFFMKVIHLRFIIARSFPLSDGEFLSGEEIRYADIRVIKLFFDFLDIRCGYILRIIGKGIFRTISHCMGWVESLACSILSENEIPCNDVVEAYISGVRCLSNFARYSELNETAKVILRVLENKDPKKSVIIPDTLQFLLDILASQQLSTRFIDHVLLAVVTRLRLEMLGEDGDNSWVAVLGLLAFLIHLIGEEANVNSDRELADFLNSCRIVDVLRQLMDIQCQIQMIKLRIMLKVALLSKHLYYAREKDEGVVYLQLLSYGFLKISNVIKQMTGIPAMLDNITHISKLSKERILRIYASPSFVFPSYIRYAGKSNNDSIITSLSGIVSVLITTEEGRKILLSFKNQLESLVSFVGNVNPHSKIQQMGSLFAKISSGGPKLREMMIDIVTIMIDSFFEKVQKITEDMTGEQMESCYEETNNTYLLLEHVVTFLSLFMQDKQNMSIIMKRSYGTLIELARIPLFKNWISAKMSYEPEEWREIENILLSREDFIFKIRELFRVAINLELLDSSIVLSEVVRSVQNLYRKIPPKSEFCSTDFLTSISEIHALLLLNSAPKIDSLLKYYKENKLLESGILVSTLKGYCFFCGILQSFRDDCREVNDSKGNRNFLEWLLESVIRNYSEQLVHLITHVVDEKMKEGDLDSLIDSLSNLLRCLISDEFACVFHLVGEIQNAVVNSIPEAIMTSLLRRIEAGEGQVLLKVWFSSIYRKYVLGYEKGFPKEIFDSGIRYLHLSGLRLVESTSSHEPTIRMLMAFYNEVFRMARSLSILTSSVVRASSTVNSLSLLVTSIRHLKYSVSLPSDLVRMSVNNQKYVGIASEDFFRWRANFVLRKEGTDVGEYFDPVQDPIALYTELKEEIDFFERNVLVLLKKMLYELPYSDSFPLQRYISLFDPRDLASLLDEVMFGIIEKVSQFIEDDFELDEEGAMRLSFWMRFVTHLHNSGFILQEKENQLIEVILSTANTLRNMKQRIPGRSATFCMFENSIMIYIESLDQVFHHVDIRSSTITELQLKQFLCSFIVPLLELEEVHSAGLAVQLHATKILSLILSSESLLDFFVEKCFRRILVKICTRSEAIQDTFLTIFGELGNQDSIIEMAPLLLRTIEREWAVDSEGIVTVPLAQLVDAVGSIMLNRPYLFYESFLKQCEKDENWNIKFNISLFTDSREHHKTDRKSNENAYLFHFERYFDVAMDLGIVGLEGLLDEQDLTKNKKIARINKVGEQTISFLVTELSRDIEVVGTGIPCFLLKCLSSLFVGNNISLHKDWSVLLMPLADAILSHLSINNENEEIGRKILGRGRFFDLVAILYFISTIHSYENLDAAFPDNADSPVAFQNVTVSSEVAVKVLFMESHEGGCCVLVLFSMMYDLKKVIDFFEVLGEEAEKNEVSFLKTYFLCRVSLICAFLRHIISTESRVKVKRIRKALTRLNFRLLLFKILSLVNLTNSMEKCFAHLILRALASLLPPAINNAYPRVRSAAKEAYLDSDITSLGIINSSSLCHNRSSNILPFIFTLEKSSNDEYAPLMQLPHSSVVGVAGNHSVEDSMGIDGDSAQNECDTCDTDLAESLKPIEIANILQILFGYWMEDVSLCIQVFVLLSGSESNRRVLRFIFYYFLRRLSKEEKEPTNTREYRICCRKVRSVDDILSTVPLVELDVDPANMSVYRMLRFIEVVFILLIQGLNMEKSIPGEELDLLYESLLPGKVSLDEWENTTNFEVYMQSLDLMKVRRAKHYAEIIIQLVYKSMVQYRSTPIYEAIDDFKLFSGVLFVLDDPIFFSSHLISVVYSLVMVTSKDPKKREAIVERLLSSFEDTNNDFLAKESGEREITLTLRTEDAVRRNFMIMSKGNAQYHRVKLCKLLGVPRARIRLALEKYNFYRFGINLLQRSGRKLLDLEFSDRMLFNMKFSTLRTLMIVYGMEYDGEERIEIISSGNRKRKRHEELIEEKLSPELQNYLLNEFTHVNERLWNDALLLLEDFNTLLYFPRLLSLRNKERYFYNMLEETIASVLGSEPEEMLLEVRRDSILEDSLEPLLAIPVQDLQGCCILRVEFKGEEAVDYGGVEREWLNLLISELMKPETGMFEYRGNVNIINTTDVLDIKDLKKKFNFLGRIMAYSILRRIKVDLRLPGYVYKHILGHSFVVDDIREVDVDLLNAAKWIEANEIPQYPMIPFSVETTKGGKRYAAEPVGIVEDEFVSEENKERYLKFLIRTKLMEENKDWIDEIVHGFRNIIPTVLLTPLDSESLELVLTGTPIIDVSDWEANTEYVGYDRDSKVIGWFWAVVRGMRNEDKARLLKFATGSSRVPVEGFAALRGADGLLKFQIHKSMNPEVLPTSHTCFNQLTLPAYEMRDILQRKLFIAFKEGNDHFGFV